MTGSITAKTETAAKRDGRPPNIVFIHTDSMDGRKLGCMGHPAMAGATPNIDRLAAEGTLFTQAYANNSICCPSRASTWSGLFTHHCEGWNNFKGLAESDRTFLDDLEAAGYQSRVIGKTDFRSGHHSVRARVTAWLRTAGFSWPVHPSIDLTVTAGAGGQGHPSEWTKAAMAVDWLGEHAKDDAPLFLYLGLRKPHFPFKTADRWFNAIDPGTIDLPPTDECTHPVVLDRGKTMSCAQEFDAATSVMLRRIYFAMIAETDAVVGTVLEGIEAAGLADSTVVVFSSDHGELAMDHGQLYKGLAYEGSTHVPLIVRGPGLQVGQRLDTLVSLVDLYPTFMELAGRDRPAELDGVSLVPDLSGRATAHPGWALAEYHDTGCLTSWFMLRQDRWKYVAYPGYPSQLFDMLDDPDEVHDLAAEQPGQTAELDRRLREIVDYEAVAQKVREYDRNSFRAWREEHQAAGDYADWMACFAAGYKNPERAAAEGAVPPSWPAADEERIEGWLNGSRRHAAQ